MIEGFRFAEPVALYALVAPLLIVVATWYAERRRREAAALTALPSALRRGASHGRRLLRGVLVAAAALLLVIGAARPQWGYEDAEVAQRGIDLVIVLDVSRSMLAEDIAPSRAAASAAGLQEMLVHLTGNRVGLVTFAGSAFERSPLTLDLDALASLIARAQQEAPLVQPGSDLAAALDAALDALEAQGEARGQAILLVTDGEEVSGDVLATAQRAITAGIRIDTVFAATNAPTALPEASGGTDITTGDRTILDQIASMTGGDTREVQAIAGLAVDLRRLQQTTFDEDTERQPIDRFTWFLAAGLALLALDLVVGEASRLRRPRLRGGLVTASIAALILGGCAGTALYRAVEEGNEAYAEGRYEDALVAYQRALEGAPEDPAVLYNLGNTWHMLGRLREATDVSRSALDATTDNATLRAKIEYALGNHAFMDGQVEAARDRYIATLRLDPTDADAKANLELLLWYLEAPPPPPQEGEDGDTPSPDDDGEDGEQPGQQPQPGEATPAPGAPSGEGTPPPGEGQPGGQPGSDAPPGPSGEDGSEGEQGGAQTFEEAQAALAEALGSLGPEVTREEALRILELARRANELAPLPGRPGGGVPAR